MLQNVHRAATKLKYGKGKKHIHPKKAKRNPHQKTWRGTDINKIKSTPMGSRTPIDGTGIHYSIH